MAFFSFNSKEGITDEERKRDDYLQLKNHDRQFNITGV